MSTSPMPVTPIPTTRTAVSWTLPCSAVPWWPPFAFANDPKNGVAGLNVDAGVCTEYVNAGEMSSREEEVVNVGEASSLSEGEI